MTRILVGLLVGGSCFACGTAGEEGVAGAVAVARDPLISWTVHGGSGFLSGPVAPAASTFGAGVPAARLYARNPVGWGLIHMNASSSGTWLPEYYLTSTSFVGRPAAAWQSGFSQCNTVFTIPLSADSVRFMPELDFGAEFGGCGGGSLGSVSGALPAPLAVYSPAASSWFDGSTLRYDVFVPLSVGGVSRLATSTGTGTGTFAASSPSWSAWSVDYGVVLAPNTAAGAVSIHSGRIDLFVCDSNNQLRWKTYLSGVWSGWATVPTADGCFGTPSVAGSARVRRGSPSDERLQVVSRDAYGNIIGKAYWIATGWQSGWTELSWSTAYDLPSITSKNSSGYQVWTASSAGASYGDL